jgi:hypothetical protein
LIAYFVAPLDAILTPFLTVFNPVGTVLCHRSFSNARSFTHTWAFSHARSFTNAWPFADACAWALASGGQGCGTGA